MSRSPRRGVAVAAVVLAVIPFAAACGTGNRAASVLTRPKNAEATLGSLRIQNVALVLDKDNPGQAALSAVVANLGAQSERLVNVQVSAGAPATGPVTSATLRPVSDPSLAPHGVIAPAPLASTPPADGVPGVVIPGGEVAPAAGPAGPVSPSESASPSGPASPTSSGSPTSPGGAASASASAAPSTAVTLTSGGELTAPANGSLFIGMPGAASASFTGLTGYAPGMLATVTFQFERSGQQSLQVAVVPSTGVYASITPVAVPASPSPSASASATASASASPGGKPSGSASPAASRATGTPTPR